MLEAWKIFNQNGKRVLKILTSSDVSQFDLSGCGIELYTYLDEADVKLHFAKSNFAIVPVIPEITETNGTFKTAAFSCICIGQCSNEFRDLEFVINALSYRTDILISAYTRAINLSTKRYAQKIPKSSFIWYKV